LTFIRVTKDSPWERISIENLRALLLIKLVQELQQLFFVELILA
jgi:hypothetical protein